MTLLYDEAPIAISPTLARVFGLNAAVFLQQVHYWIEQKKQHGSRYQDSYKDGQFWVYNTIDEWLEQLPFMGSKSTFKRMLSELQAQGVLIVDNFNKRANDHTGWYRINYIRLQQIAESVNRSEGQNEPPGRSKRDAGEVKMNRSEGQNEPSITKDYTETTQRLQQTEDLKTPHTPQGGLSAEEKFFADSVEVESIDLETAGSMAKHFGLPFPESPLPKQPDFNSLPKGSGRTEAPSPFAPLPKHDPEGFRQFWAQHPRKVGRQNAVRAWDKIKPDPETKAQIMHALAWNKANNPQWTKDGGQFIPHPATWLNGQRWTDEQTVITPEQQSRPMSVTEKNLKFLREYREKHGLEA